jgi:hypothetical protein
MESIARVHRHSRRIQKVPLPLPRQTYNFPPFCSNCGFVVGSIRPPFGPELEPEIQFKRWEAISAESRALVVVLVGCKCGGIGGKFSSASWARSDCPLGIKTVR